MDSPLKQSDNAWFAIHRGDLLRSLAVLLFVLLIPGCCSFQPVSKLERFEFQQPHMGTLFTITLFAIDKGTARDAANAAFAKVAELNQMMTDYDPDSELMRLSGSPVGQPLRISAELFEVLKESQRIAKLSNGAFDVTVGPVVRLWRRSRRVGALPAPEQLAQARERVGWQKLQLDSRRKTVTLLTTNMQLDLGGIGKGYAADQALAVLRTRGINRALVAASGDIAAGDPPPGQSGWRVAIGSPADAGAFTNFLQLANAAVSTSGDSEQFVVINGKRYSHIVDPHTGVGLTNRCQVSVIAPRATHTDAFDTTICVLGMEKGRALIQSQPGMSAIIYRETSAGWEVIKVNR